MGWPPMSCSRSQRTRTASVYVRARRLDGYEMSDRAGGLEPRPIEPGIDDRIWKPHRGNQIQPDIQARTQCPAAFKKGLNGPREPKESPRRTRTE